MDVDLISGRPEEDELLALKEEGNMRAIRWMVNMTPPVVKTRETTISVSYY